MQRVKVAALSHLKIFTLKLGTPCVLFFSINEARDVLWCLVFCGFAVNYMIRINLNIAIVEMVKPKPFDKTIHVRSECIVYNTTNSSRSDKTV